MPDEPSIYDLVTDELVERQKLIKDELRERFKKTRPYRQEPVSHKEIVMDYDDFLKNEAGLRVNFGDEAVDNYKLKLLSRLGRK